MAKENRTNFWRQDTPRVSQRMLMLLILQRTKFASGTHRFKEGEGDPIGTVLARLGLTEEVYICISPIIKLSRKNVPREYAETSIDMREFTEGVDDCDHAMISLYWETGSSMDSYLSDQHHYDMCCLCGYHPTKKNPTSTADAVKKSFWRRIVSHLGI